MVVEGAKRFEELSLFFDELSGKALFAVEEFHIKLVCQSILCALCHFYEEEENEVSFGLDGREDHFDPDIVSPGLLDEAELFVDDRFFWNAFDVTSDDHIRVIVFDFL